MFHNSIIPKKNLIARKRYLFPLMIIRNFQSKNTEISYTLIYIKEKKKCARKFWLNIKLIISKWVELQVEVKLVMEEVLIRVNQTILNKASNKVSRKCPKNISSSKHTNSSKLTSSNNNNNTKESFEVRSAIPTSLIAQEEDTRIQFKSNYAYYTLWFIIAVLLMIVMFSNFFYNKGGNGESGSSSEEGESSSSSYMLGFGILSMLLFIYFIVQFVLAHFNVSRPQLPFESINPLFVFNQ